MLHVQLVNFNSIMKKHISKYFFMKMSNLTMYYEIKAGIDHYYEGDLTDLFDSKKIIHNGINAIQAINIFLMKQMN